MALMSQLWLWTYPTARHCSRSLPQAVNTYICVPNVQCCPGLIQIVLSVISLIFFFKSWRNSPVGQGLLIVEDSRPHSDTPHSVGLLWTSDQPHAQTSAWQHTTLTTDRHPCPRWVWTHNLSKLAAADPRLRPHGHWDRQWESDGLRELFDWHLCILSKS